MSGDLDLEAVFGRSSPDDAFAAVLTEARMVLAEIASPLQAELWGSDILAALGGMREPGRAGHRARRGAQREPGGAGHPARAERAGLAGTAGEAASSGRPAGRARGCRTRPGRPAWARRRWARVLALRGRPGGAGSRDAELRVPGRAARGLAAAGSFLRRRRSRTSGSGRPGTCWPGPRHGGRGSRHDFEMISPAGADQGGTGHRRRRVPGPAGRVQQRGLDPGDPAGPRRRCWPAHTLFRASVETAVKFESTALDFERRSVHTVLRREQCSPD